ncbi:hypothetical protein RB595_006776 [Gaeumannomyces hyphopodioides]
MAADPPMLSPAATPGAPAAAATTEAHHGTPPVLHTLSLLIAGAGLLGLALPPRRADRRALVHCGALFLGSNQLAFDYTGESILQRFSRRAQGAAGAIDGLPEPARRAQEAMRAERERRRLAAASMPEAQQQQQPGEPKRPHQQQRPPDDKRSDWVREWDEKEKKAFEDGRGLSGLIEDTIKEAFGFGKAGEEASGGPASAQEDPKKKDQKRG